MKAQTIAFICQCVAFQNKFARDNYNKNKNNVYGNEDTQELARKVDFEDWIFEAMKWDLETCEKNYPGEFIWGSGHNHLWVSDPDTDKRLMMIVRRNEKLVIEFDNPDLMDIRQPSKAEG